MGQTCCGLEAATEAKEAYQDLEAMYRKIERLQVRMSSRDEKLTVANARVNELEQQLALLQQGRQYVAMDEFSPEETPFCDEYDRDEITSDVDTTEADTLRLFMAENAGRHIIHLKRLTSIGELVSGWKNLMQHMATAQSELRYQEQIARVGIINDEWKSLTAMLARYHTHAVVTSSPAVTPTRRDLPPDLLLGSPTPEAHLSDDQSADAIARASASLETARTAFKADLKDIVVELNNAADELEEQEEIMLEAVQRASKSLAVSEADSAQRFNSLLDHTAMSIEAGTPSSRRNSAISTRRVPDSPASTPH